MLPNLAESLPHGRRVAGLALALAVVASFAAATVSYGRGSSYKPRHVRCSCSCVHGNYALAPRLEPAHRR